MATTEGHQGRNNVMKTQHLTAEWIAVSVEESVAVHTCIHTHFQIFQPVL